MRLILSFVFLTLLHRLAADCWIEPSSEGHVDVPDTETSIPEAAFSKCRTLITINIPSSVTSIGAGAFQECKFLKGPITIPDSVTAIADRLFLRAIRLEYVSLPSTITSIGKQSFDECKYLTAITIPANVQTIGMHAFEQCYSLTQITIPDSVVEIGAYAFWSASSLYTVKIGTGLKIIEKGAFARCITLKHLIFEEGSRVTDIEGSAFRGCTSLIQVVIPGSMKDIKASSFYGCYRLKTVNLGNVLRIGKQAFYGNEVLKSIELPDSVLSIGEGAFGGCLELESVRFGKNLDTLENSAFSGTNIMSINISDTQLKEIGTSVFSGCSNAKRVDLGSRIETIGDSAFSGCSGFTSIVIPTSVRTVGTSAFYGCTHLKRVVIHSTALTLGGHIFQLTNLTTDNILYKRGLVATDVTQAGELVALHCAESGICGCMEGYGNYLPSDEYFNCIACPRGSTSPQAGIKACTPCVPGRYADRSGQASCSGCEPGKASNVAGAKDEYSCELCSIGRYMANEGARYCADCPPGAYCSEYGLSAYTPCPLGMYARIPNQAFCSPCEPGLYQNQKGQAFCDSCPKGTSSNVSVATSNNVCKPCEPGTFSSKAGADTCTSCPIGSFAANKNQSSCQVCTEDTLYSSSDYYTSNWNNTACVEVYKRSESLMILLFDDGIAMFISILMSLIFLAAAAVVTFLRRKNLDKLGQLALFKVVIKSLLPGFGFGSEIFLIISMSYDAIGIAMVMLCFRLMHAVSCVVIASSLTETEDGCEKQLNFFCVGDRTKESFDREFSQDNIIIIQVVFLLSACDLSMIQFLPWKKSLFYEKANGYPTYSLMKYCLALSVLQSLNDTICELVYLMTYSHIGSSQLIVLFYINILMSVFTLLNGLLNFCLKNRLLAGIESEKEYNESEKEYNEPEQLRRGSVSVEMENIYTEESVTAPYANPMHTVNPPHTIGPALDDLDDDQQHGVASL